MKTKKHCFFASVAAAAALVCYACSMQMPERLTIKTDNFSTTLPGTIGSFNIAKIIAESLNDKMPEGLQIYDVVNYNGAKAFLAGYEMELVGGFNPGEYLNKINGYLDDIDGIDVDINDDISAEIELPEIRWSRPPEIVNISLSGFFEEMEKEINEKASGSGGYVTTLDFPLHFPSGAGETSILEYVDGFNNNAKLPKSFMVFNDDVEVMDELNANFNAVFIAGSLADLYYADKNIVSLTISLLELGQAIPDGLEIKITDIGLFVEENIDEGLTADNIGFPPSQDLILNKGNGFSSTIEVNISGKEISWKQPPNFHFDDIIAKYNGVPISDVRSYNMKVQPAVKDIELSGARGLKIGTIRPELPDNLADEIESLDLDIDGFLNAQIGEGTLEITAVLPSTGNLFSDSATYCDGITIGYEIYMEQAQINYFGDTFNGLSKNAPWNGQANALFDLKDIVINNSPIDLILDTADYSQIIIKAADEDAGITFELFGDHLDNKTLPIDVGMNMQVTRLQNVNWELDPSLFPAPAIPPINFDNAGVPSFIKSITFDEISLDVKFAGFPSDLNNVLAIKLESDIFKGSGAVIKQLTGGEYPLFTIDDLKDPTINLDGGEISFAVAILPGNPGNYDKKYIVIPELDLTGSSSLKLEGDISFDFSWKQAVINMAAAMNTMGASGFLTKSYPDKNEDPINLNELLGEYMTDITFARGLDAKMFLNAPTRLIDVLNDTNYGEGITLEFDMDWEGKDPAAEPLFSRPLTVNDVTVFPEFPQLGAEYTYLPTTLVTNLNGFNGLDLSDEINDIIEDLPNDMRFRYNMRMPVEFTVEPGMFDFTETGSGIKAMFAVIIPMNLIAKPGPGAEIKLAGIFPDGNDLFGRNSLDNPVFNDINVKALKISLDFGASFMSEAYLHINSKDLNNPGNYAVKLFGDNGLRIGKGRIFEIALDGSHWEIIKNNLIYPDIKISFPQSGATISIPKDVMPLTITVSASGSYTFDF